MKKKTIIIIDDKDQSSIIEDLQNTASHKGISLSCLQFKPNTFSLRTQITLDDGSVDFVIDLDKVKAALDTPEFLRQEINLIACDYNLEDNLVSGLELSVLLRSIRKNMPILFYSTEDDLFEKKVYGLEQIKKLIKVKFKNFVIRKQYPEEIIKLLGEPMTLEQQLSNELYNYRMLKFYDGFPIAGGMALEDILEEVNKDTDLGSKFAFEMLQLTLAHIVDNSHE